MDLGLRDKTALVLGAGGGLGGAIAERLAAEGVRVAVADIDAAAAGRTVSTITERSGKAIALTWDLADLGVVQPNLETISKAFGPVDILVNITGGPPPTPVSGQPDAVWRKYFDAMVLSIIAITDAPIAEWSGVRELPVGEVGEITVVGPTTTDSYFNRPQATAAAKIREVLGDGGERIVHRMGDVGWFDAQGRLWFCGRKTQRVETAQGPLYTEQVEPVFNTVAGVRRTALVGVGAPGS